MFTTANIIITWSCNMFACGQGMGERSPAYFLRCLDVNNSNMYAYSKSSRSDEKTTKQRLRSNYSCVISSNYLTASLSSITDAGGRWS